MEKRIKSLSGKNNPCAKPIIDKRSFPEVIYETKTSFLKINKVSERVLNKLLKDPNSGVELYKKE